MRVAYDLTGLELDASGSARAIVAIRDLLARRDDVELIELAQPRARTPLTGSRITRGLVRELIYEPLALPARARRARAEVLHCPIGIAPALGTGRVPLVVTVHDAMAVRRPEWFGRANVLQQRHVLARALRRAAAVLAPTRHAAGEIADAYSLETGRVRIVPLGVDAIFTPGEPAAEALSRLGLGEHPYLLTVGTLQPRKNVEATLRAFEALHADGAPHRLVVAGARGWRDDALAARLGSSPAAAAIVLPGRVSDADLVTLYRGAAVFVFPSRYEGFGLPPLEAMACGAPVVAADRTAIPEVVGDAALLADPDDADDLRAAIERALQPGPAAELRGRGLARAAQFGWERAADLTVEAYRAVLRT